MSPRIFSHFWFFARCSILTSFSPRLRIALSCLGLFHYFQFSVQC
jgi:hypothetical protein